jgi:UDP-D-galactose:(glucosyl)LPS alpha-1,6-D-galactosyltransferase
VTSASLLVLASDYEGFGLVVVEALARGIPVISTNVAGPSDIIKDGVNGWLIPPGDFEGLNMILQKVINGEMALPSAEICEESVRSYRVGDVVNRMEKALYETYARYGKK